MLQNTTQEGYIYFTQLAIGCVVYMFIYLFICSGEGMLQEWLISWWLDCVGGGVVYVQYLKGIVIYLYREYKTVI